MILLLGGNGYVGRAFQQALRHRKERYTTLSRNEVDYTRFKTLLEYLRSRRPDLVINAAGFTGKPNVDACEKARADAVLGNVALPLTVSHACSVAGIPWGLVASGCIYSGAIIEESGQRRVEPDLTTPEMQRLLHENPGAIRGFREEDEPTFTFRRPTSSFYSGTKALAEELLDNDPRVYVWRLRMPFSAVDCPRNYLSKLQRYAKIYENVNSLSHLDDYVNACLDLWGCGAPFGVYNVTNPGFVTTRQVVELISRILRRDQHFEYFRSDEEFYQVAARTPRANCVLDSSKLTATGVAMRTVHEALSAALKGWQPEVAH